LPGSKVHRTSFVDKGGFLILAAELKKAPVSASIADVLFSLTCGEPVHVLGGLDSAHLEKIVYGMKIYLYKLFNYKFYKSWIKNVNKCSNEII
jgi:hypothetical protein